MIRDAELVRDDKKDKYMQPNTYNVEVEKTYFPLVPASRRVKVNSTSLKGSVHLLEQTLVLKVCVWK